MWRVAKLDEQYIERMEDVLEVYENPLSASASVVCIDEKPVVLHEDIRALIPMRPGQVARRDYEYKRCGTANVFCGVEPKAGRHFTKVTPKRCSAEFADYLLEIAARYSLSVLRPRRSALSATRLDSATTFTTGP